MKFLFAKFGLAWAMPGLLAVIVFGSMGCQGPRPPHVFDEGGSGGGYTGGDLVASGPGEEASAVIGPDLLRRGDRVIIVFSGNPNAPYTPHQEQIRDDGHITPPLLGTNVVAAGKTIGQLQMELHSLYVPSFFQTLTITVRSEERYFSVGGQVNRPGQFLYRSDMTLLKAIQVAGDFTDFANRRRVLLTRKDGSSVEVDARRALRDARYDPPVYPGDLIHVPQRW